MTTPYSDHTLLVLGGGEMQVQALRTARRLGLASVCVDPNPNVPCRELADEFYVADLADLPKLEGIATRHAVAGVVTLAADYPLRAVSALCERLDLHGPSPHAVATVTDKARLRGVMRTRLGSPLRWEEVAADCQGTDLLGTIDCIVKPADSSGGRGVTFVPAGAADSDQRAAVAVAMGKSRSGRAIIEEFIEGPEFSVEALTYGGRTSIVAITRKLTSGPPYFMEIGHSLPAELSAQEVHTITEFVRQVIAATEMNDCASHAEVKLTERGPILVEIGARLGGGYINTDLVPLAHGVEMTQAVIDIALGFEPTVERRLERGASIRFLLPEPGLIENVEGLEEAAADHAVHRLVCGYRAGDEVPVIRDATGRKAYVICTGASAGEAEAAAGNAAGKIVFRMKNE